MWPAVHPVDDHNHCDCCRTYLAKLPFDCRRRSRSQAVLLVRLLRPLARGQGAGQVSYQGERGSVQPAGCCEGRLNFRGTAFAERPLLKIPPIRRVHALIRPFRQIVLCAGWSQHRGTDDKADEKNDRGVRGNDRSRLRCHSAGEGRRHAAALSAAIRRAAGCPGALCPVSVTSTSSRLPAYRAGAAADLSRARAARARSDRARAVLRSARGGFTSIPAMMRYGDVPGYGYRPLRRARLRLSPRMGPSPSSPPPPRPSALVRAR